MKRNLVSIIIPTYNRSHLLPETLDSILEQTYLNWECIVIDDGSTDSTEDLLKTYTQKDNRFQYVKRPESIPKGANSCRNYGLKSSNGDWILWFDSDDIMHQSSLEIRICGIKDDTELLISRSAVFEKATTQILYEETRTHPSKNILEDFITQKITWYLPDGLWKRSFLGGKMLFDENLFIGQDRDFHIRMLLQEPKISFLRDCLTFYRQHAVSTSNQDQPEVLYSSFFALDRQIKLVKQEKLSHNALFFLMRKQLKLYPLLVKKDEKPFKLFLKSYQNAFKYEFRFLKWGMRFLAGALAFKLLGKGSIFFKDSLFKQVNIK